MAGDHNPIVFSVVGDLGQTKGSRRRRRRREERG